MSSYNLGFRFAHQFSYYTPKLINFIVSFMPRIQTSACISQTIITIENTFTGLNSKSIYYLHLNEQTQSPQIIRSLGFNPSINEYSFYEEWHSFQQRCEHMLPRCTNKKAHHHHINSIKKSTESHCTYGYIDSGASRFLIFIWSFNWLLYVFKLNSNYMTNF